MSRSASPRSVETTCKRGFACGTGGGAAGFTETGVGAFTALGIGSRAVASSSSASLAVRFFSSKSRSASRSTICVSRWSRPTMSPG